MKGARLAVGVFLATLAVCLATFPAMLARSEAGGVLVPAVLLSLGCAAAAAVTFEALWGRAMDETPRDRARPPRAR